MPAKEFLCKKCGDMHKRPINSKCPFAVSQIDELNGQSESSPTASGLTSQSMNNDLNMQILAELKNLGGRMTAMEQRMAETDHVEVNQRSQASQGSSDAPATSNVTQLDQVVVPSVTALQGAYHIQVEVDR